MRNSIAFIIVFLLLTSCEEALETPIDTYNVTLLAPANNVVSDETDQTFYWEKLDNATQYQLQVVTPKFDSIVKLIVDTTISANQFTQILEQGSFQWRVKAQNNSTTTSFSQAWNLTIQ